MKKIFLILPILLLTNFVHADCGMGLSQDVMDCTLKQVLSNTDASNYGKGGSFNVQQEIPNLEIFLTRLRENINNYKKSVNVSGSSCQKITNKMWLRTSRINDSQVNGDVSRLQKFFKSIGIVNWDGDGEFGTWDRAAVWKFQQQYMPEISPTGDVGVKTMAEINSMICDRVSNKDFISWKIETINPNIEPPLQRITATLNPDGYGSTFNLGSYEIRNNCSIRNEKYPAGTANILSPWVSCYYALSGINYAVFNDLGSIYSIKSLTEDASGLTIPDWKTLKTVAPYAN